MNRARPGSSVPIWQLGVAFLLVLLAGAPSGAAERDSTDIPGRVGGSVSDRVDYFAANGFGKPVSTLQHPAGEYYDGVTYLAYQGPHEDPYVCAYNHETGAWEGPVQAGVSALGRTPAPNDPNDIDNHGRPALIVDGDGYIHLVFGGHGGHRRYGSNPLGYTGGGRQTHVVSKNPGDISAWQELDNIPPFGTYSQFIKMPDGTIYLFYRHGSHRSDWVYQRSTDNARSFSPPVSILKHKPQDEDPTVHDAWYAWFAEGPDNTVVCSYNYHPCASWPNHTSLRVNAYCMKMDCNSGVWENMDGQPLSMPLTREMADSMTRIIDSRGEKTRLGTVRTDGEGNPHLYFRYFSENTSLKYARWNGREWLVEQSIHPEYRFSDGDMLAAGPRTVRMLLMQKHDGVEELCWWYNGDGSAWEHGPDIIRSTTGDLAMSALIRNAHPDARVIVAEMPRNGNTMSSKMYLLGDSGPVRRKASEIGKLMP
jgi:hypothetical protein